MKTTTDRVRRRRVKSLSSSERMLKAKNALELAISSAVILKRMEACGYPQDKIKVGRKLLAITEELFSLQKRSYGDLAASREELDQGLEQACKSIRRAFRVAKVALKEQVRSVDTLGLERDRQMSLTAIYDYGNSFYVNLLNDEGLVSVMASFGYDKPRLEQELLLVDELYRLNQKKEQMLVAALESTRKRDEAMVKLNNWMSDFYKIAKIALADLPEVLKKF